MPNSFYLVFVTSPFLFHLIVPTYSRLCVHVDPMSPCIFYNQMDINVYHNVTFETKYVASNKLKLRHKAAFPIAGRKGEHCHRIRDRREDGMYYPRNRYEHVRRNNDSNAEIVILILSFLLYFCLSFPLDTPNV